MIRMIFSGAAAIALACAGTAMPPTRWSAARQCTRPGTSSRTRSIRRITRRSSPRSRRRAWSTRCRGKGPFTVFAPTNEAFAKLPAGTVETLVKPENKATLTKILTYHVVPGRITARRSPRWRRATTARPRSRPSKART